MQLNFDIAAQFLKCHTMSCFLLNLIMSTYRIYYTTLMLIRGFTVFGIHVKQVIIRASGQWREMF